MVLTVSGDDEGVHYLYGTSCLTSARRCWQWFNDTIGNCHCAEKARCESGIGNHNAWQVPFHCYLKFTHCVNKIMALFW